MSKVFGIDISVWQRGFNFTQAKAEGVKFAILRGMYGNGKDTEFENHYKKAKAAGIGVGAYQWGRAVNEAQAREEAQLFVDNCLKGKQFEYPIYYDVEDSLLMRLSIEQLTNVITAWCRTIENNGYYAGIYMNQSCFNTEVRGSELASKFSQWRAMWTTEKNKPNCQMWQFGGETNYIRNTRIAGVICDQDYAFEDFPTIIKNAGLNGYGKATPIQIKTVDELAQEVIDGVHGNNQQRKDSLGARYNEVQARVNELLKNKQTTAVYYKIVPGDTLSKIANKFGTTINQLMNWNNIKNANLIWAGKTIRVK